MTHNRQTEYEHLSVCRAACSSFLSLRVLVGLAFVLIFPLTTGCATITTKISAAPPPVPQNSSGGLENVLHAGASKVDITPPPGYPMGGHSIAGRIGRGHWLRLYARAIFLEDRRGVRVALVSTDLWSVPAGLADRVAELNSNGPSECRIGRSGLILAATHTHQSPANFSSSAMYNTFASPLWGFDPDLFEFLAQRIALSVEQACEPGNRRKVDVFLNEMRLNETRLNGQSFARNRSFEAFMANRESTRIIDDNKDLPTGALTPEYPYPDSYRAVDPTLKVLRIKDAEQPYEDIAVAAFVAVHNTSLTHDAEVYNSDLFGAASIYAEKALARGTKTDPVVAIFNGAEGDISPAWNAQDRRDTVRFGSLLANNILTREPGEKLESSLNYRFDSKQLAGACIECPGKELRQNRFECPEGEVRCTDKTSLPGFGMLGGAEDGRTFFYYLGCREGIKGSCEDKVQGCKKPALTCLNTASATLLSAVDISLPPAFAHASDPLLASMTRIVAELAAAPREVPIGVYTIGSLALATLPGEFTMTMGRRIAEEIKHKTRKAQIKAPVKHVVLIGLANEYVSYFTTPDEYQEQAYEGASTVFGVVSGEVVRNELGHLAEELDETGPAPEKETTRSYHAGLRRRFGIDTISTPADLTDKGFAATLQDIVSGRAEHERMPVFCWEEKNKSLKQYGGNDMRYVRVTPEVSVVINTLSAEPKEEHQDDTGLNFVTFVHSYSDETTKWCSFWMMPDSLKSKDLAFSFEVTTTDSETKKAECSIHNGKIDEACLIKHHLAEQ